MSGLMRVPFFEDELLLSFVSRTARANGARSLRGFCFDLGLDYRAILLGDGDAVAGFARVLGRPEDELLSRRVVVKANTVLRYAGLDFSRVVMGRAPVHYCPRCLEEDDADVRRLPDARRYGRTLWTLRCVQACYRHERYLLPVPAGRTAGGEFGFDLGALPHPDLSVERSPKRVPPTRFERFVATALAGSPDRHVPLDGCMLPVAIELCEQFGLAETYGRTYSKGDGRGDDNRQLMERGFNVLEGGAPSIEALLERLSRSVDSKHAVSCGKLYGTLYHNLCRRPNVFNAVKSVFRTHAFSTFPHLPPSSRFGSVSSAKMGVNVISSKTGASLAVVKAYLLQYRLVQERVTEIAGAEVDADVGNAAIAALLDAVTFGEACELLECSRSHLESLVISGFIRPMIGSAELEATFSETDRYLRGQILAVRDRLIRRAGTPTARLTSLTDAVVIVGCELGEALRALHDGRLNQVGYDGSRALFDGLEVDPQELRTVLDLDTFAGSALIRNRLFLCQRSLGRLVAAGILRAVVDGPAGTTVFLERDVARFERRYVTIARLAAEYGVEVSRVRSRIRKGGLRPAIPGDVVTTSIYLRAAAEECVSAERGGERSEISPLIVISTMLFHPTRTISRSRTRSRASRPAVAYPVAA